MKTDDIVGQRFGMLTVLENSGQKKHTHVLWRCKCDCGREVLALRQQLTSGAVQSCGCTPKPPTRRVTDLIGRRFGKLTVAEDSGLRSSVGEIRWRCQCDCGGEALATRRQLVSGNVASCGCVPKQYASKGKAEDLTGRQFGELTVLRRAENNARGKVCWLCKCSCGKELTVQAVQLKSGKARSCGCARRRTAANRRDLTGQRFGRLTALYPLEEKDASGKVLWRCRCDCGNETVVPVGSLVRGLTKSCGCLRQEVSSGMHDHMHYRDDTCVEMLERAQRSYTENKSGFRGLFLTKDGLYRATITFRKVHYHLGYFRDFDDAVKARLNAEQQLHAGYVEAYRQYQEKAEQNPAWAEENPFYYNVRLVNGAFSVSTTRLR